MLYKTLSFNICCKEKKTLRNIAFILLTIKNINIKKFTLKVKIDLHAHYKYCKKFNSLEKIICIVKKSHILCVKNITYFAQSQLLMGSHILIKSKTQLLTVTYSSSQF